MIFNFWKRYPKHQPKEMGWYLCTLENGKVMDLYFDWIDDGKWLDKRRLSVFNGYKVYKPCREPLEYNRIYEDTNCERIDVIAWKMLPKPYSRK